MKLRTVLVTASLGAAVLTAAPVILAPGLFAAYACDNLSDCDPDPDEDEWEAGYSDGNVSYGMIGEAVLGSLPTVVVIWTPEPLVLPPPPPVFEVPPGAGGSNGGGSTSAFVYSQGQKEEKRTDCLRNEGSVPVKSTETINYTVSYQVSANITASAMSVLSATLGVQLNTTISRSSTIEVSLNPGQTWGLFVEYQTVVYAITTPLPNVGYHTEFVNVTQPTGVVTGRSC